MDLALNNLQRLICHKTQQTQQTKPLDIREGSPKYKVSSTNRPQLIVSLQISLLLRILVDVKVRFSLWNLSETP